MPKMRKKANKSGVQRLNNAIRPILRQLRPPENLTVSEWADKYRVLTSSSAEPGAWRTNRTPYLKEIMDCFTDPHIRRIVMVASSQVGKSEMELNVLGYIMDQDPGTAILVQPTLEDARKFSRLRIGPMIQSTPVLHRKVRSMNEGKTKTILQKSFPGGMLTITGSNSASALASTPARYLIGDERDRWAVSAGDEGDPWKLGTARQITFYNAKSIEVSTPTVKGHSNIESAFYEGTQERYMRQCPECGAWHDIVFDNIKFQYETKQVAGNPVYSVTSVGWACPSCGCLCDERTMKRQPAKWVAENPDALASGVRSFWLNAFSSPWASMTWNRIVMEFLMAKDNPMKLQVVYNTILGQLWEDRGDLVTDDTLLARREDYGAELPDGVLVLTCGVDTQDDRLEYEVLGHGRRGETWGIHKGIILGRPDTEEVWERLDGVIEHDYAFENGKTLHVSCTFVDSGGHFTRNVYEQTWKRSTKRVFAIKGSNQDSAPYTKPPTQVAIDPRDPQKRTKCYLYTIGVSAGKAAIMANLKVQKPGRNYCHFPKGEGYDETYFSGLLSEHLTMHAAKGGSTKWRWEKLPGHERNEPLDIRNYALAAFETLNPDLDAAERALQGAEAVPTQRPQTVKQRHKKKKHSPFDDW